MSEDTPQIYLITPPDASAMEFPDQLAACLDATEIACVRLSLAETDPDEIARTADRLRTVSDARDVALVIDSHIAIAARLGLDGVHLTDGARSLRLARDELGEDAIVGTFCGDSRHEGMNAGERMADYVSFGPVRNTGIGDGREVDPELFAWWTQMVEVPVVAEGGMGLDLIKSLRDTVDFVGLRDEVWRSESPATMLQEVAKILQGA